MEAKQVLSKLRAELELSFQPEARQILRQIQADLAKEVNRPALNYLRR